MRKLTLGALLLTCMMLQGCERFWNTVERDGGIIGSYPGDWIVVRTSGGRIVDVWKLKNVMLQSEERSDGWLFIDQFGNAVNIGGDIKAVRVKGGDLWDKYREYHQEFDGDTYVPPAKQ